MRPLTKTGNYISTRIGRAIADHKIIEDRDRILVAVSGGKDSMAMLRLLSERRKWAPVKYELIAMHVETDYRCAGCVHTKLLKKFFEDTGVKYHFEKIRIRGGKNNYSCFWCSWNRRKALFRAAKKFNPQTEIPGLKPGDEYDCSSVGREPRVLARGAPHVIRSPSATIKTISWRLCS